MCDKVRALSLLGTDRAMTEGSSIGCNSFFNAGEEGVLGSYGSRLILIIKPTRCTNFSSLFLR